MSEELPREEGLPAESEESERWISNLFSALPEGRPNLFSLGVRAAERTEISRVRVCATCRRSLDKLNFSRTQWNKKQVGVSRCWECVSSDLEAPEASERWTTEAEADVPREPFDWYRRRARERAREREVRRNEDYDAEAAERRPAQRLNKEERTVLCCLVLGILLYFCCVVVAFAALADVPSGCAVALIMVAFALSFKSGEKENRCRLRAALVIHVLGLLLLVVAMVLLAMKTHRVMSLTPDPTCEPWAGSCQEGGQRSDGRTECSDCSDEVSCVDVSAAGLWWSERGARYFPASEKYGRYWGWGRTRRLNGCGIPQKPSERLGIPDGSFGASGNTEQKRRWEAAKETGDCRPLFTSQAKCEDYWGRWQDAWSEEWGGACIVRLLFNAALIFYGFSFFSEIGPDILFFCLLTR
ncbi:unnamed protein product [Pelagomonas calceolata]|uniref:Transmembrane protein n=1 Tax=Pelagomonas calceolata TaxID=35677 RepID=A0A7S4E8N4_9STRA|nr:unnamed protein product [Pelagomonas calceolata]|mmetsp:Transcript_7746/g.21710  ORF Transcript_7746/g.21710 Transcript_7746/m.21710 type:complete len:413 (-) Transcript_7746:1445-2683(-)